MWWFPVHPFILSFACSSKCIALCRVSVEKAISPPLARNFPSKQVSRQKEPSLQKTCRFLGPFQFFQSNCFSLGKI